MSNSSICPIIKALSGFTTQSGPGSNGNDGELHIPKAPGQEPQHQIV